MPDRKYTYQIEIDATQAKQQAAQLRALFERELGEIMAGGKASSAAAPVQAMRREIEQISKIDLTAPIDDLQAALRTTQREINALAKEYDRLTLSGTRDGKTPAEAARYRSYVEEVRTRAGDDAAAAIASTGQYLNIGQRGAKEATDNEAAYLQFARDYHNQQRDVTDKQQRTIAEKMEVARVEAQLYEAQLQEAQAEKEIARRRVEQYERQIEGMGGLTPETMNDPIWQMADDAGEEMQRAADNERFFLQQIAEANDKVADLAKQEAAQLAEAERAVARRTGDIAGAVTGGTTTTRLQMTVTDASAAQAERLAAAYQEAAQSSGQIAENTERISKAKIEEARGVRESARDAEQERRATELQIRDAERQTQVAIKEADRLAAVEKEQARQARIAAETAKSAQSAQTATARAEANQRTMITRAETAERIEAEKRTTLAAKAEYNRQTQELKREAAERTAAARASSGGTPPRDSIFGMTPGMMAGSALAAVGVYSVDQVARATYESGRSGAMLERQAQTFRQVAQRVGVAADAMIASIKRASKETITDADAMGLGAQVLAQKWASSSADIVGDTGRLVEASRRLAQIYPDENGQILTTTEVFTRLLKYVREGNKELVDQFGISNARIAESLGITTKGLAAAGGASDRFRGLLKVLGEDMERLGPAMLTTADQFEQSEARITTAKQRIDKALAGPIGDIAEGVAGGLEGLQVATGNRDPSLIRQSAQDRLSASETFGLPQDKDLIKLIDLLDKTDELTGRAADSSAYYKSMLAQLGAEIIQNSDKTINFAADLAVLERQIALTASGQDAHTRALEITTDEAIKQDARFMALVTTMGTYQRMYEEGTMSLESYNRASGALAVTLFNLANAAGVLAPALAGVNAQLGAAAAAEPGGSLQARLAQSAAWRDFASNGYRPSGLAGPLPQDFGYGTPWAATQAGRDAGLSWFGERAQDWANVDPYQREVELNQMRADADRKAADAAAREWESAAKSAQSEWESAAKAAADAFKGALEAVPGLFGTTSVTDEDMTLAKYGMYEEKADEYLRQLRDEVINKKDYAGVDIRDAASRLGIDPNLAPEAILAKFEQAWANSSLFAGGANLDLINADAVKAGLAEQEASKSGKEAILKFFGFESADVEAAGAETRSQFVSGFTGEGGAAPTAEGEQADFLTPILDGMDAGLKAGDAADRIYGIGGAIVGRLYAGFTDAANNLAWGKPILDSLAASVAPQVYDMLAEELTP